MTATFCGTAGTLAIRLSVDAGSVAAVDIQSTRPLGTTRVFLGKPIGLVLPTLPLLFGVCASAQAAAAVLAAEASLGVSPSNPQRRAREALVLAETAREHLLRCLLGWGGWLGEPPTPHALALPRRLRGEIAAALYPECDGFQPGGGSLAPDRRRLAEVLGALDALLAGLVLGVPVQTWLEIRDAAGLDAWARGERSLGARLIARVMDLGWSGLAACDVPALCKTGAPELDQRLTGAEAEAFIARPTWEGRPRETGALVREATRPLIADLARRCGNGLLTRLAARLSELAGLPGRIAAALESVSTDAPPIQIGWPAGRASGVGQVEAARGRLIHRVEIEGGQVRAYRILAPTEWNFHPEGVLARGLRGIEVGPDLAALAALYAEAVDPCVGYRIEVRETSPRMP